MSVLTAHKILITTAVVFFFGFALWELTHAYQGENFLGANFWNSMRAILYLAISVGFSIYLKSLKRWLK